MPIWQNPRLNNINISAHAAAVLSSATRSIEAALKRRQEMDRAGKQNEPLVVIVGENHSNPGHHLRNLLLLDGLNREEGAILTCEHPHTILVQLFKDNASPVMAKEIKFLQEADKSGEYSLKAMLGFVAYQMANHSIATLFHYLLNTNIQVKFTDTAIVYSTGLFLDTEDPSTAASLSTCFNHVALINAVAPDGITARNHHMIKTALAFAEEKKEKGARFLIQQCGTHHVMGSSTNGYKAENSLAAQFKNANASVLAIPDSSLYDLTPIDHGLNVEEYLITKGMPEIKAYYSHLKDRPVHGINTDISCQMDEAAYFNGMLAELGMESAQLSVEDRMMLRNQCRHEIYELFDSVKKSQATTHPARIPSYQAPDAQP